MSVTFISKHPNSDFVSPEARSRIMKSVGQRDTRTGAELGDTFQLSS